MVNNRFIAIFNDPGAVIQQVFYRYQVSDMNFPMRLPGRLTPQFLL